MVKRTAQRADAAPGATVRPTAQAAASADSTADQGNQARGPSVSRYAVVSTAASSARPQPRTRSRRGIAVGSADGPSGGSRSGLGARSRPSWRRSSLVASWVRSWMRRRPGRGSSSSRLATSFAMPEIASRRTAAMSSPRRCRSSRIAARATASGSVDASRSARARSVRARSHASPVARTTYPARVNRKVPNTQSATPSEFSTTSTPETAAAPATSIRSEASGRRIPTG